MLKKCCERQSGGAKKDQPAITIQPTPTNSSPARRRTLLPEAASHVAPASTSANRTATGNAAIRRTTIGEYG